MWSGNPLAHLHHKTALDSESFALKLVTQNLMNMITENTNQKLYTSYESAFKEIIVFWKKNREDLSADRFMMCTAVWEGSSWRPIQCCCYHALQWYHRLPYDGFSTDPHLFVEVYMGKVLLDLSHYFEKVNKIGRIVPTFIIKLEMHNLLEGK